LSFSNTQHFLIFLGLSAFVMLLVVNLGNALMVWLSAKISNDLGVTLGERLLRTYLYQPYAFFLNQNSANMSHRLLQMVSQVKTGIVFNGVTFCANSLVIFALMGLLVMANPMVAASAIVCVVGVYIGIYGVIRKRLQRISEDQAVVGQESFKTVSEAFGGIKDLSLLGQQKYFLNAYTNAAVVMSHNQSILSCVQGVPRYLFELLAFGGVLLMIVSFLAMGQTMGQLLPTLAVFVYAGYRLLPASQGMLNALSQFKANQSVLGVLHRDFSELSQKQLRPNLSNGKELNFEESIVCSAMGYSYPESKSTVLRDVNLVIPVNNVVGIIGPTGAGKTTLVDLLLGLLQPTEGQLRVDGAVINLDNVREWQRRLGYVSQHIYLSDDTVSRNIAFGIDPSDIDQQQVERAAKAAAIHDFICDDLAKGYDTEIGERGVRLSGGQRQRIGIARALYHNPSVLVMDEATSALDGATESAVMGAIHALAHKKTIIIIAHRLSTVAKCDSVIFMHDGRVQDQGTYQALLDKHPMVRNMANLVA